MPDKIGCSRAGHPAEGRGRFKAPPDDVSRAVKGSGRMGTMQTVSVTVKCLEFDQRIGPPPATCLASAGRRAELAEYLLQRGSVRGRFDTSLCRTESAHEFSGGTSVKSSRRFTLHAASGAQQRAGVHLKTWRSSGRSRR